MGKILGINFSKWWGDAGLAEVFYLKYWHLQWPLRTRLNDAAVTKRQWIG
jgi:hypothetical protein